jgi:ankyrin repeat protein
MSEELEKAAFAGDVEAVERLLDAGANIDRDGRIWNALHAAIENGNVDCIELLIGRGAEVEHRATGNLSPLAHAVDIAIDGACQSGCKPGNESTDIISLLLEAGAEPASGLEVARGYKSTKIVGLLTSAMKSQLT